MATAVRHANQYRLHLQQQLARVPQMKEMYAVASRSLAEVQEQVKQGERPPNYAIRFEVEVSRLAKELNELMNATPGILFNSCQDQDLRDEMAVTKKLRQRAASELAQAKLELQQAQERIGKLRSALFENRGPETVPQDGSLPSVWAIMGNELLLNPAVFPQASIDHYQAQWRSINRELAVAASALFEAEQRHQALDAKVAELREQMIQSPI